MADDEPRPTRTDLVEEVQSGDMRRALIAIRDYVVHELDGNRCSKCSMSQLKTGDTAALILRLQKILEEIANLPAEKKSDDDEPEELTGLARVRALRAVGENEPMGSRSSPRTQGGPRRRG